MITEAESRRDTVAYVARLMMMAARTAPKGRGRDTLFIALTSREEQEAIAAQMDTIANREGVPFFARDAQNIRQSDALILMGSMLQPLGIPYCGYCGFEDCAACQKQADVPCAFNLTDLGIALGVAVSVAAAHHVDNRIMYSAGRAARDLHLCSEKVPVIFAIPLSVSSKNPFFDR